MADNLLDDDGELLIDLATVPHLQGRLAPERDKSRTKKINNILRAAVAEFAEEGMSGFSMRRIAANAGVTLSTLQHYFGNRHNLLIATISTLCSKYIAKHTRLQNSDAEPRLQLEKVLGDLLAALGEPLVRRFYTNLWATAGQDPKINDIVGASYRRYYEVLAVLVSTVRKDISQARAYELAVWIASLIDGMLVARTVLTPGPDDWNALGDSVKAQCMAIVDAA